MESKHTPGPWRVSSIGLMNDGSTPIASEYGQIARVTCFAEYRRGRGHDAECDVRDANARLIAAAPELLPVVELIASIPIEPIADDVPVFGLNGVYITHGTIRLARAAIAKATGK